MAKGKSTSLTPKMRVLEVCKYMDWNYQDYQQAPNWMVQLAVLRMGVFGKQRKLEQKRAKRNRHNSISKG